MQLRELFYIFEGYKEALSAFANSADQSTVKQTIDQYKTLVNKNQIHGNERNIDFWVKQGWEQFSNFVNAKINEPSKTQIKRKSQPGQSINLMENDEWLIIIPLDKNASCFYGKHSSWCTAKPFASHFENYYYDKDILLIYCLHKNSQNMWAIAAHKNLKDIELFDKNDKSLSEQEFSNQTGLNPRYLIDLAFSHHNTTISKSKEHYQNIKKDIELIMNEPINHRVPELEKQLLYIKSGQYSYNYIKKLIDNNQIVSDIPEAIVRSAIGYQPSIIEYFPNASEQAQKEAVTNNFSAAKYIQNPSDNIIKAALSHHGHAINYLNVSNQKKQELIHEYPKAAAVYAANNNITIPEMEDKIAQDPLAVYSYLNVYKKPWPNAENAILKNAGTIAKYVKQNLKGQRWPEAEKVLLNKNITTEPYSYFQYAQAINKPWPEAEHEIAKEPDLAAQYAVDIIKKPWPSAVETDDALELDPADNDSLVNYATQFGWDEYIEKWESFFNKNNYDDDYY